MRMQHDRHPGGRHRPRAQQARGVLHRFLDHRFEVQLANVAAVGEGEPRLHLRVLLGDRLQHAVGDGPLVGRVEPAAVVDLDLPAAVQDAVPNRVHWRMAPPGPTPVPPTVSSEIRMVGWPTETGTPWPSLPQVPGASFRSLPTMSILYRARGPLPTMVAPRTGRPIRPPSIR